MRRQSTVAGKRGFRAPHRDKPPLWSRLLRRCVLFLALPWQRPRLVIRRTHSMSVWLLLIAIISLTAYLIWTLNRSEALVNNPVTAAVQNPHPKDAGLGQRAEAMVKKQRENGFLSTYWEIEDRTLPRLTKKALESWFDYGRHVTASAMSVDVDEEVLAALAWDTDALNDDADADLFDSLSFLYPPAQQIRYYRAAMNTILRHGPRVGGSKRDTLLHHLLDEGLGRRRYDATRHTYHHRTSPPHLSLRGQELLEKTATAWPDSPHLTAAPQDDTAGHRVPGWRWSLSWDNFTADIPIPIEGSSRVEMQNLVFQFPGGSQFRRKQQAATARAAATEVKAALDEFVGSVPNRQRTRAEATKEVLKSEHHPADLAEETVYSQETFLRQVRDSVPSAPLSALERGVPGARVALSPAANGVRVPLKPSLSAPAAEPVTQQPMKHVVLAAHWDSKYFSDTTFLGACDSAMPMVFLLRTIKNIAVLTDVAEALAESYKVDRVGATGDDASIVVPGLTSTFRNSTTEAEVRERLASLLSPAHHALLYQYFFARPYSVGEEPPSPLEAGMRNHPTKVEVDVRTWLDWVQHLPIISVILFDGEEAYNEWLGDDNTYGSRHLARRWRSTPSVMRTRYSGGTQSLYDSVDLFALYDLMGPAGTSFHNIFPTQSGIIYASLAQRETELRHRAMKYSSAISAELLWRYHETNTSPQAGARLKADPFLRVLGPSPHASVANLNTAYIQRLLTRNESRPSVASLPRTWLMYGAPHEMHTLHGVARSTQDDMYVKHFEQLRVYDRLKREVAARSDFDAELYLNSINTNIFFSPSGQEDLRRSRITPLIDDDHKHWLDTQRVLHLIAYPFPESWHTAKDDGSNVHDGTSTDLAGLLWSTVLELGDYWTRKE